MHSIKIAILILISAALFSCENKKIKDKASFYKYLDDPENGLCISKQVNQVQLKAKYLPAEYLAYKDFENHNQSVDLDSIIESYSHQVTIMLSIGPSQEEGKDIMIKGIYGYKDFKERLYSLNFEIEAHIKLKTFEETYRPVLSSFERLYGLKTGRDILFVFTPEVKTEEALFTDETLVFEYDDKDFGTGLTHFKFKRKDIDLLNSYDLKKLIKESLEKSS